MVDKLSRSLATRDTEVRQWQPASLLPEPMKIPGWVTRWCRTALLGQPDHNNMSLKFREGWEPVNASEHPEVAVQLQMIPNKDGNFENGGLLLCKMPEEMNAQRKAYYENLTAQQMSTVDNEMFRDNDPRMPLFKEAKSKVSRSRFGDGS